MKEKAKMSTETEMEAIMRKCEETEISTILQGPPTHCEGGFENTFTFKVLTNKVADLYRPTNNSFPRQKNLVYFDEKQFVAAAKNKWSSTNLKKAFEMMPSVAREVKRLWNMKAKEVPVQYPQYYSHYKHIPLTYETACPGVTFNREEVLHSHSHQPRIHSNNFPMNKYVGNTFLKLPRENLKDADRFPAVSQDSYIEHLLGLREVDVDVVISRSGLKTLIDCYSFDKSPHWMLPFCIKEFKCVQDARRYKKVLFIDKAFPRQCMNKMEQKNWHGKIAVNSFSFVNKKCVSEETSQPSTSTSQVQNDKEIMDKLINEEDEEEYNGQNTCLGASTLTNPSVSSAKYTNLVEQSYSYELWKMNQLGDKIVLLKNAKRDLNILVRNKNPALKGTGTDSYCVSSKLEYQQEYGGEQISLSQLKREWVSLVLNPNSKLLRVRADANTLDYISHEERDLNNVETNIKHLYSIRVKSQLTLVYNVLNELITLQPGKYLLRNMDNEGRFASIFVASNRDQKFDLHKSLQTLRDNEEEVVPWPMIDMNLITSKVRIKKPGQRNYKYKENPNEYVKLKGKSKSKGKRYREKRKAKRKAEYEAKKANMIEENCTHN